MKEFEELSEVEVMLRSLVYAYESKDKPIPNCPIPNAGEHFLKIKVEDAKDMMKKIGIPLVSVE